MKNLDNSLLALVKEYISAEEKLSRLKQNKLKNRISELEKEVFEAHQENQRLQTLLKKKKFWFF